MKIVLLILCFITYCLFANGQYVFSGKVSDEKNKPLSSASVTLHKKSQAAILAFAITDKNGDFQISFSTNSTDTLELQAALLGYGKQIIYFIPGDKTIFNFSLSPQAINLPEVKVKNSPVWQRKDTINYNTSEFKQPEDRVIGDIIARLPGMEVKPGGQILYNGKPINKYYIENLDLLEDKYGVANNNIPADAVDKVQVLENHQPIRVLDSVSFSDRAAINIKLKNSAKMRLIGRARLGAGASPLLSEDELMAMLFKKKIQFINTYKYDNTGLDNSKELNSQNIYDFINALQNGAVKNDLVSLSKPSPPPVNSKRFLFNNQHVFSVNNLVPLNKLYTLRINADYVNDFVIQQSRQQTKYFLPADTIVINEQTKGNDNTNMLKTDITLQANTANYFFKNTLHQQSWFSSGNGSLITNTPVNQQLKNPFYNFSNDFRLVKTKKKKIEQWASYIGYTSLPQSLNVLPGLYENLLNSNQPYSAMLQKTSLHTFFTDNYFSVGHRISKINAQYKAGFSVQHRYLFSDLQLNESGNYKMAADSFQNHLQWNNYKFYEENEWNFENTKLRISFRLPLSFNHIQYSDTGFLLAQKKDRLFINPSLSAIITITPLFSFNSSVSYNQSFADITNVNRGYYFKDYRTAGNNNVPLGFSNSTNISGGFVFRNPLKILFFNTFVIFQRQKNNLVFSNNFSSNLQTVNAILRNNYQNSVTINSRFSKYMMDIKTSITLNGSYRFDKLDQLQQDIPLKLYNKNFQSGISISTKLSSFFTAEYSNSYNRFSSKSQLQQSALVYAQFNHTMNLNFYPSQKFIIRFSAEYYHIISPVFSSANYFFGDIIFRYKPKKSRLDFESGCTNIFNTVYFTTGYLSNNVEAISEFKIRPRQILFKIGFPF